MNYISTHPHASFYNFLSQRTCPTFNKLNTDRIMTNFSSQCINVNIEQNNKNYTSSYWKQQKKLTHNKDILKVKPFSYY